MNRKTNFILFEVHILTAREKLQHSIASASNVTGEFAMAYLKLVKEVQGGNDIFQ